MKTTDCVSNKPVGFFLWVGIFLMPLIFAWFTLKKGRPLTARIIAFAWLIFVMYSVSTSKETEKTTQSEASKYTIPPVSVAEQKPVKVDKKHIEAEYPHRKTPEELADDAIFTASVYCQTPIERQNRFDVKWTDSVWDGTHKFDTYTWLDQDNGIIAAFGDQAQFQNKYGAYEKISYRCDFDVFNKNVLHVYVPAKPVIGYEVTKPSVSKLSDKELILKADDLNGKCRGGPGDNPKTLKACDDREVVIKKLRSMGICWGDNSESQTEAGKIWQQCTNR